MEATTFLFCAYALLGLVFFILNKKITYIIYNLILYFTNKLNLKEVFIFRIDDYNRNSMFFLMRSFTILFGLLLIATSAYYFFL